MDIVRFLRENGTMDCTEADIYYVIKFFDSDEDGKLNYPDFLQIVLPCTNYKMRAEVTQRMNRECRSTDYLTMDVEQDLSRLLKAEVKCHKEQEYLKQQFEAMMDYSPEGAYKCVDSTNMGFIDTKCLDNFFKRLFTKKIELEDEEAIIRRLDLDSNGKLNMEEFIKGISS